MNSQMNAIRALHLNYHFENEREQKKKQDEKWNKSSEIVAEPKMNFFFDAKDKVML